MTDNLAVALALAALIRTATQAERLALASRPEGANADIASALADALTSVDAAIAAYQQAAA